jgi:hypothetical protein
MFLVVHAMKSMMLTPFPCVCASVLLRPQPSIVMTILTTLRRTARRLARRSLSASVTSTAQTTVSFTTPSLTLTTPARGAASTQLTAHAIKRSESVRPPRLLQPRQRRQWLHHPLLASNRSGSTVAAAPVEAILAPTLLSSMYYSHPPFILQIFFHQLNYQLMLLWKQDYGLSDQSPFNTHATVKYSYSSTFAHSIFQTVQ